MMLNAAHCILLAPLYFVRFWSLAASVLGLTCVIVCLSWLGSPHFSAFIQCAWFYVGPYFLTSFLLWFAAGRSIDNAAKFKACFSKHSQLQELLPCQAWELMLIIPSLDVWALLFSWSTLCFKMSFSTVNIVCSICPCIANDDKIKACFSEHSQLPRKSFCPARLES